MEDGRVVDRSRWDVAPSCGPMQRFRKHPSLLDNTSILYSCARLLDNIIKPLLHLDLNYKIGDHQSCL